ncbi:MAG: hypothetical protein FWB76_01610 [Oscillospiraceae bacterium]|nr:hypothetical protein [Oscillospiraceae bacterium]
MRALYQKLTQKIWPYDPEQDNHVSFKEFLSWCFASMGLGGWNPVFDTVAMTAGTATLSGLIFGLRPMDIFAVSLIATIMNYVALPLGPYIIDNMGRFPRKVSRGLLAGGAGALALGIVLWMLPPLNVAAAQVPQFLVDIVLLPDLLRHIALRLFIVVGVSATQITVLRLFGRKYGKFKPMMIFFGPLVLLLVILVTQIPYQNVTYSTLLLMTHFVTGALDSFRGFYADINNFQNRISPNPQERSRIMSIAPIFTGLLRSIYRPLFPLVAVMLGGLENIRAYQVILPIYGAICLAQGLLVLRVQERVIEEKNHVARVKFKDGIREVFKNKYQWIRSISDVFTRVPNVWEGMIVWTFIYATRMPWAFGLAVSLYKLPTSTTGQLMTPLFTKHFSKRQVMLIQRLLMSGVLVLLIPATGIANPTWMLVALMAVVMLRSFLQSSNDVVNNTLVGDIWDYQQWKSGERLEMSVNTYFRYITDPLLMLMGYVLPFLLARAGFFGDMDILYDPEFFRAFATTNIWFTVICSAISALPFIFYDLTPKKMAQISADLKARVAEKEAQADQEGEVSA